MASETELNQALLMAVLLRGSQGGQDVGTDLDKLMALAKDPKKLASVGTSAPPKPTADPATAAEVKRWDEWFKVVGMEKEWNVVKTTHKNPRQQVGWAKILEMNRIDDAIKKKKLGNKDGVEQRLAKAGKELAAHTDPAPMPGYGQIFLNDSDQGGHEAELWYVGGDGDEDGFAKVVEEKLREAFPAVSKITYEAESFPSKNDGWRQVYPVKKPNTVSKKLDAQGGEEPNGKAELERAKHADLITLPPGTAGTNCGNCSFFRKGFCTHPEVQLTVTDRNCCAYWDNGDALRAWGGGQEKSLRGVVTKSEGGPCEQGQTAASTGCTPKEDPAVGSHAEGGKPTADEAATPHPAVHKPNKLRPASRTDAVLLEAEEYQLSDKSIGGGSSIGEDDFDDIEAAMTPEEKEEAREELDRIQNEAIDEAMSDFDPEVDPYDIAVDLGYTQTDVEERAAELITENVQDEAVTAALNEVIAEWTPGPSRRFFGSGAIDNLRKEFHGVEGVPQELLDAMDQYSEDAEKAIDEASVEAADQLREGNREAYNDSYDGSADRRDYLRNFYRENEDRFNSEEEECPPKSWCMDADGDGVSSFTVSSGRKYRLAAVKHPGVKFRGEPVEDIQFSDETGSFAVTGKAGAKEALEVFANVVPAVVAYIKKGDKNVVSFSAAEESRQKLYDRLVRSTTEALPEYFAISKMKGSTKYYVVGKKEMQQEIEDKIKNQKSLNAAPEDDGDTLQFPIRGATHLAPGVNPAWWTEAAWNFAPSGVQEKAAGAPCGRGEAAARTGCIPRSGGGGAVSGRRAAPGQARRGPGDPAAEPVAAGLAVVANDTGRVLMMQRQLEQGDPESGKWEFPGGKRKDDEVPLKTAVREWTEEVGLALPEGKLDNGGQWLSTNGKYQGFIYRIPREEEMDLNCRKDDADPASGGWVAVAWVDPKDIPHHNLRSELKEDIDEVMGTVAKHLRRMWVLQKRNLKRNRAKRRPVTKGEGEPCKQGETTRSGCIPQDGKTSGKPASAVPAAKTTKAKLAKAYKSARKAVDDFNAKVDALAGNTPVLKQVWAAKKFISKVTKKIHSSLEKRYGKLVAGAIMASGQAIGWGGSAALTAALGYPVGLWGATVWGIIPGVALAETFLRVAKGVKTAGNLINTLRKDDDREEERYRKIAAQVLTKVLLQYKGFLEENGLMPEKEANEDF